MRLVMSHPWISLINVPVQGKLVRQHNERFEHLPENIRVSEAIDDVDFMRKVSRGQYFVTNHDTELAGFGCAGSCRESDHWDADVR